MAFKMIHADERERQAIGQALGVIESDQQGSGKAGPLCDRDGTEVLSNELCLRQCRLNNPVDGAEMGSCGQFRNHTAEPAVYGVL